ncbi:MAG: adenosylcobinamide-GDP ribazoletransferase [Candidatus Marinarcus sp.]|uniref:adenosylcobinamide-GDP ribazoletransferase n=1 Tax=Candidatus Marinarcus sp. TaxID=3100987 RepID=UPI003AFFBFB8
MKTMVNGFLLGFSYFSVLPIHLKALQSSQQLYRALLFSLPVVGLVLALICVGLFTLLKGVLPLTFAAILCSVIYLILYGFLHLEAVCDVIDGWYASLSGKDIYAIMKEPQIGAIGAIGTFLLILLKISALCFLLIYSKEQFFIIAAVFSRLGLIYGLSWFDFHEKSKFALQLKSAATFQVTAFVSILFMVLSYFILDSTTVFIFLLLTLFVIFSSLYILKKKFGFLNGDCLGFSLELSEVLLLIVGLML